MRAMKMMVIELNHGIMGKGFRLRDCGSVCWWRRRKVRDGIRVNIAIDIDAGVEAE